MLFVGDIMWTAFLFSDAKIKSLINKKLLTCLNKNEIQPSNINLT